MDLDDFRSIMETAGVDVWTFIDTAILVASLDYGQELKRRRDNIVERLYATSMANKCRNCDFGSGGVVEVAAGVRVNGRIHEEEEDEEEHHVNNNNDRREEEEEVREKSVDRDDEDDFDPFAGLFDDEQKSILEIKERLEDPDLSEESLVELLQNLEDMDITFQALQETDIGRHVNRVRKHPSNNVRRLAKNLVKKWKETVDEWVKFNQPGDLEPSNLIADEDSPHQKTLQNGNRQQVPDFGYSPVPQRVSADGYSGSSKNSNITEPERKQRPVTAPPPRRESPSPAKPSRPSPSHQTNQREKEHKEVDFDTARKRLQQNYRQAENAKKQRTIQVMDIHEIPKPKKGGFFPRRGGSSQGGSRHW